MNVNRGASSGEVVAFYYPQFHPCAVNDRHYGNGFTEWDLVRRAEPLFIGHSQPRQPTELGYYDLRDESVYGAQVALARSAGLGGFCFYHYWFSGRRLLEDPFEQMLASSVSWPFCVMWANHPWNLVWKGAPEQQSVDMTYASGDPEGLIRSLLVALVDDRYIRIDGRPLLLIYDFDDLPEPDRFVDGMRAAAAALGVGEIHISVAMRGLKWVRSGAIDSIFEFPPHGYSGPSVTGDTSPAGLVDHFQGRLFDYRRLVAASLAKTSLFPGHRVFRTVVPGWDNTGRRTVECDASLYLESSPELFGRWTEALLAEIDEQSDPDIMPVVFVNAWNEWGEGAYLEPDVELGRRRLDAVASATGRRRGVNKESVLSELTPFVPREARRWSGLFIESGTVGELGDDRPSPDLAILELTEDFPASVGTAREHRWTSGVVAPHRPKTSHEGRSDGIVEQAAARLILESADHKHRYEALVPLRAPTPGNAEVRVDVTLDFRTVEPGGYALTVEAYQARSEATQVQVSGGAP